MPGHQQRETPRYHSWNERRRLPKPSCRPILEVETSVTEMAGGKFCPNLTVLVSVLEIVVSALLPKSSLPLPLSVPSLSLGASAKEQVEGSGLPFSAGCGSRECGG